MSQRHKRLELSRSSTPTLHILPVNQEAFTRKYDMVQFYTRQKILYDVKNNIYAQPIYPLQHRHMML